MAHDFGIRNTKKEKYSYFFGYAGGLMYRAFGEIKHDMGKIVPEEWYSLRMVNRPYGHDVHHHMENRKQQDLPENSGILSHSVCP